MGLAQMKKDAEFAAGLLRKKPFSCLLQITNRCNMECSFCDFWPNVAPKKDELTAAEFARIADELAGLGTFLISIEGGEPFVRPDLVDIVRALSKKHITALFTNGWYVTPEKAKALWDAGLTHADVSIDYPDAARHDAKRRLAGATERAWAAVEMFRDTAPRGGKQVHVMTVLMEDNWLDLEPLLQQSASRHVGHQVTLLSTGGFRRGKGPDKLPPPKAADELVRLWDRYPHLRYFREYFEKMEPFLAGSPMPTCHAGAQGFNIDHVGNVAPCIEKIDEPVGNVRTDSLATLHGRLLAKQGEIASCQACWTACRGIQQIAGGGGNTRAWLHLGTRMRTT
jgi:MoaA/NifB/PqqE/SkfB family radical SAM enzyme